MQAILQSKHQEFSDWIKDVKQKQPAYFDKLTELEDELQILYNAYQHHVRELKQVILEYEEKQKEIRNEVKRRNRLTTSLLRKEAVSTAPTQNSK